MTITGKEVDLLKHKLYKWIAAFLINSVAFHTVSISQVEQPASYAKVIAVEAEAFYIAMNLLEDIEKAQTLISKTDIGKHLLILVLAAVITTLILYGLIKWKYRLKQFLYPAYFQSSYFSNYHLYSPLF